MTDTDKLCVHITIKQQGKNSNGWDSNGDDMIRYAYHNATSFYNKAMSTYAKKFEEKAAGSFLLGNNFRLKVSAREGHVYISIGPKKK